jgi:hypothetical protein
MHRAPRGLTAIGHEGRVPLARMARSRGTMSDRGTSGGTRQLTVWRCGVTLLGILATTGIHDGSAAAAGRTGPVKIGALTDSWGPTPQTVGLRDGRLALGYREGDQFVIGVRFTQGDPGALPAAAQDLVQSGVDVIFAIDANAARAAPATRSRRVSRRHAASGIQCGEAGRASSVAGGPARSCRPRELLGDVVPRVPRGAAGSRAAPPRLRRARTHGPRGELPGRGGDRSAVRPCRCSWIPPASSGNRTESSGSRPAS